MEPIHVMVISALDVMPQRYLEQTTEAEMQIQKEGENELKTRMRETNGQIIESKDIVQRTKLAIFIHGLLLSHLEPLSLLRQEILIIARGCHVCD